MPLLSKYNSIVVVAHRSCRKNRRRRVSLIAHTIITVIKKQLDRSFQSGKRLYNGIKEHLVRILYNTIHLRELIRRSLCVCANFASTGDRTIFRAYTCARDYQNNIIIRIVVILILKSVWRGRLTRRRMYYNNNTARDDYFSIFTFFIFSFIQYFKEKHVFSKKRIHKDIL